MADAGTSAAAGAAMGSVVPGVGTVIGGLGGALIGGISSLFGQSSANRTNKELQAQANKFSAKQAQKQMDFQREMSSTAYQRSMADMKAAGLNPMLAYSQGGASTPSGAMGSVQAAKVENALGPAIATALEARRLQKEIKAVDSQTDLNNAVAMTQRAQTKLNETNAKVASKNAEVLEAQMPAITKKAKLDAAQADIDQNLLKYDNITRRVGQATGIANSAKDLINPFKFGAPRASDSMRNDRVYRP